MRCADCGEHTDGNGIDLNDGRHTHYAAFSCRDILKQQVEKLFRESKEYFMSTESQLAKLTKERDVANLQVREASNLLLQAKGWMGIDPTERESKKISDLENKIEKFLKSPCAHVFTNYQCDKCGAGQDTEKKVGE